MHTAFGKSDTFCKVSDALRPVCTNGVANENAFGPQSHGVGPCSEGWLKSWLKSALQSTRSTAHCPALCRYSWSDIATAIKEAAERSRRTRGVSSGWGSARQAPWPSASWEAVPSMAEVWSARYHGHHRPPDGWGATDARGTLASRDDCLPWDVLRRWWQYPVAEALARDVLCSFPGPSPWAAASIPAGWDP
jgi:hypothetical protein